MAARASRRYAGLRSAGEDLEQQEEQKLESPFGSPIKTSLLRRSEDGGRSPLRSPFRPSPSVTTGHARKGLSAQTLIIIALGPVFYLLGRWTSSRSLPHPSAAEGREPQNYVDAFRRDLVDMDQQLQSLIKDGAGALEASKSQWCKQDGDFPPLMAVSIQASKGQLEPLQWLLGAIEHRHIAVLLHMEKSAPESEHNQLQKIVDSFRAKPLVFSHIEILTPPSTVSRQGISAVDLTLRFINVFVREYCGWRYYVNLSAEDLPLFGPDDLLRILLGRAPKETNFMDVNHADVFGSLISRTTHAVLDDSLFRRDSSIQPNHTSPFRRRYPDLFHPYHGEAWHILSRSFCSYITTSLDGFPRRLFAYYANYPTPDEGYFQTLLCASDLQETLAGDWLRFTDWSGHQEASGPTPITLGHVPSLAASGALFAHPIRDRAVAESIRGELRKSRVAMLEAAAGRVGRAPRGCGSVVLHREEALLQNLDVAYWH